MPVIAAIFGFLGSFAKGLFGFKGDQAKTVQDALDLVKSINNSDAANVAASANALTAILTQGSWLERIWRPMLMILLITLIACWFFGYAPSHFNDPISPMMNEVLSLLKIGVGGYIPCRTIEKVLTQFNIAGVLKQLIGKKII